MLQNLPTRKNKKENQFLDSLFSSCGGLTRTDDLWVMSPTSYQLLHSAMFVGTKVLLFT